MFFVKAPLFNINDLILLLTTGVCLFLAGFHFFYATRKSISTVLLSVFFLCIGVSALCRLLLWDNRIYLQSSLAKIALPYLMASVAVIQGISLYLYVQSLARSGFPRGSRLIFHLAPLLLCYFVIGCFQIDSDNLRFIGHRLTERSVHWTSILWLLLKLLPALYALSSLVLALRFMQRQKDYFSDANMRGNVWLNFLTGGFSINWLWSLLVHVFARSVPISVSDGLGIADNYITFILVIALSIYDLVYTQRLLLANVEKTPIQPPVQLSDSIIDKIRHGMEVDQLYLKHNLNIEEFSRRVGVPYREVSFVINKHFESNFFEYVNQYRVARAKVLLADPAHKNRTVLEICLDSGFNSKSAFNRFFRRYTGKSPTEFREHARHADGGGS